MGHEAFHTARPRTKETLAFARVPCDGARGARTPDLVAASHALSQLSYGPQAIRLSQCNARASVVLRGREAQTDNAPLRDLADRDDPDLVESEAACGDREDPSSRTVRPT